MAPPLQSRRAMLPPHEVIRRARTAAAALAELHAHGEVHGSFSPDAIDESGELVNVAQQRDFSAPELILGRSAPTPVSDVFSLGATMFVLLTGRHPFEAPTAPARMLRICSHDVPAALSANVPAPLAAIVFRCLQRDPAARFPNAAAVRDALGALSTSVESCGKRLLIADDDAEIRELLGNVAARLGVAADIVDSGRDAIAALKTNHYALALLDLNMPRIDGWQVLDFLRDRRELCPEHLVVITGFLDQRISDAHSELVERVVYKPVGVDEMRRLVSDRL